VAKWVILTPQEVAPIDGMNMATGAQEGFYGPMNQENLEGGQRSNFLSSQLERIKRPKFCPKDPQTMRRGADVDEMGHPSEAAVKAVSNIRHARPKSFFDLQISPEFIENIVQGTNLHAASEGAGGGGNKNYVNFIPFDSEEFYKFIGVLFANGLTPKPLFESWFAPAHESLLQGNDRIATAMDKYVYGRKVSGLCSWRHFWQFMNLADCRKDPVLEKAENPLWKVQSLLKELNYQTWKMWIPRKFIAIDEQTIAFKG
jgi:hypothetical protein